MNLAEDVSNGEIMVIVVGLAIIGWLLYRATSAVGDAVTATTQAAQQAVATVQNDASYICTGWQAATVLIP